MLHFLPMSELLGLNEAMQRLSNHPEKNGSTINGTNVLAVGRCEP